jgi:SOS-response transcriptional repressor LexA
MLRRMGRKSRPSETPVGQQIQQRRKELGLSLERVGQITGLSKQRLSQIERGEANANKFSADTLLSIAQFLGVDEANLVPGHNPKKNGKSPLERGPVIRRSCPLIAWSKATVYVGNMGAVLSEGVEAWYPCPVECSPETFVLRVRGASMEPKFRDGEHIFVDPGVPASADKYVIAYVEHSDQPILRQVILEGGRRYLRPANPLWPEPIIELTSHITIVGVVVYKGEPV